MSLHYSKFALNSYAWTPYFQAVVPPDFPTAAVLRASKMFRDLPPRLREVAVNSKKWAVRHGYDTSGIDRWYDSDGYELDPDTGARLTDAQVETQWEPDPDDDIYVEFDLPEGLPVPDPDSWEPPPPAPDVPEAPDFDQLLLDVATHGVARVQEEYGITLEPGTSAELDDMMDEWNMETGAAPEPPDEQVTATGDLYRAPK